MKNKKKFARAIIAGVIVMIAVTVGILAYYNSDGVRLKRQLDLGNRYLAELNYEEATVAYEAAIAIEPMSVEAYLGLADAYLGKGDYEAAAEKLQRGYELTGDESLKQKLEEVKREIVRLKEEEEREKAEEARRKEEERKKAAEDTWKSQFDLVVEAGDGIHCFKEIAYTAEEENRLDSFLSACAEGSIENMIACSLSSILVKDRDNKKYVGALYKDFALELYMISDTTSAGNIYNLNDGMGFSFSIKEGEDQVIWEFYQIPCVEGKFQGDFTGEHGVEGRYASNDKTEMKGHIESNLVITGDKIVYFEDGCEPVLQKVENNVFTVNHRGYNHRMSGGKDWTHVDLILYEEADLGEMVHLSMGDMCVLKYKTYGNVYEAIPVD